MYYCSNKNCQHLPFFLWVGSVIHLLSAPFILLSISLTAKAADDNAYPKDITAEVQQHLIVVDSEGRPRQPIVIQKNNPTNGEEPDYDIQLPKFVDESAYRTPEGASQEQVAYLKYLRRMTDAIKSSKKPRIMIVIHGGMNFIKGAVARASASYKPIQGSSDYYPIFICWDSNPFSTYWDGLVFNREGEYHRDWPDSLYSIFTTPLNFAGDLGGAVARAPEVFANQTYGDLQTVIPGAFPENQRANYRVPYMNESSKNGACFWVGGKGSVNAVGATAEQIKGKIMTSVGQRDKGDLEVAWHSTSFWATLPGKVVTAPLLDGIGNRAWNQMSARVQMMFRSDTEYNFDDTKKQMTSEGKPDWELNGGYSPPRGAVAVFIRALTRFQAQQKKAHASVWNQPGKWDPFLDVTLVGHSMGAMVINEIARYCNEQEDCYGAPEESTTVANEVEPDHFAVSNVVFFAGACTVREFESFTVPFIGRRIHRHEPIDFYNLSLHPQAELRETNAADIVPRGSLLVWIDNYFSTPRTFYDKTYGNFDTALLSTQIIPPLLRKHVYLKAFKVGDAVTAPTMPQKHGEFLDMPTDVNHLIPYWTQEFWKPQVPPPSDKAR